MHKMNSVKKNVFIIYKSNGNSKLLYSKLQIWTWHEPLGELKIKDITLFGFTLFKSNFTEKCDVKSLIIHI